MPRRYPAFSMDFDEFDAGMEKFDDKLIPIMEEAAFVTGEVILDDAIEKEPKSPHDTGELERQRLNLPLDEPASKKIVGVRVGFNVDYAGILHEWKGLKYGAIETWSKPGSGPGWLATKLIRYKKTYIRTFGKEMSERWPRR